MVGRTTYKKRIRLLMCNAILVLEKRDGEPLTYVRFIYIPSQDKPLCYILCLDVERRELRSVQV